MANDRVYLQCKACEETMLLFKYYPGGSYFWTPNEEFLNKHLDCGPGVTLHLGDDPRFRLITEADVDNPIVDAKRGVLEAVTKAIHNRRT